jgi:secreted PhoX family phosphatase
MAIDQHIVAGTKSTCTLGTVNYNDVNFRENQMLAADTATGQIRRFLTGPNGCEITGVVTTPDGRTMFINVQQPAGRIPNPPAKTLIQTTPPPSPLGSTARENSPTTLSDRGHPTS